MRVAFLVEVVLAIAVGLGMARWNRTDPAYEGVRHDESFMTGLIETGHCVLAGVGLAMGLGTWVEALRGRSPRPWGIGRRAWAFVALYVLAGYTWLESRFVTRFFTDSPGVGALMSPAWESLRANCGARCVTVLPPVLLALLVTELMAHQPGMAVRKDAREWSGRCFALAVILTPASLEFIRYLRR